MYDNRSFEPNNEQELADAVGRIEQDESRLRRLLGRLGWRAGALWRLVKSYARGEYRDVPWSTAAAACGAAIYLIAPVDALPDFLPGVGFMDDAVVVSVVASAVAVDLSRYLSWEAEQNKP